MMRFYPLLVLILAGAAWGVTQPLAKIAVSEGYKPIGILFWQLLIGAAVLFGVCLLRGTPMRFSKPDLRLFVMIALIGSVFPGITSYSAAVHLPSGVLSILLSSIPMIAFPIALAFGHETFRWRRLAGLSLGFCGISLLILPEASLPDSVKTIWVFVALFSSLCYALEGNLVARMGTNGLDPVQVLCGASLVGVCVTLPLAVATDQFIAPFRGWGAPDWAILASSLLHAAAYTSYVWLVGRAGPVFAVQISYLVTLFGVTWAMLFLAESYSPYFWAALAVMLAGLALVQPRPKAALVPPGQPGHTDPTSRSETPERC
ncbi:DMT family transporter [Marivita sp. S6314]|uniref:DMT family transporter n=1 Tax=Marivita sp. S6314 TaxID=2926406 RepID=UPI001FF1E00E|nr:DMT family transporter [Marivita sp. S6314]MCK0148989.1 DMT family transporter [Marivita sp. S6314]